MRERVLLTLFLIIFCLPPAFAKVDYSGINLQVDAFEKQEVLDIGNPVIRIEKLNGQQPIKKNKFNITTETKENAAAKSAIPFDYDKREFLKINEPIENFGFFSKKYQNADFEESIKSSPRFSGDITTLSTDEEAAEEESLEGGISKDEGSTKVAKKQRNYDKAKAFWEWFKGEPAYDALLLGMWSWHVNYDHDVNGTNDICSGCSMPGIFWVRLGIVILSVLIWQVSQEGSGRRQSTRILELIFSIRREYSKVTEISIRMSGGGRRLFCLLSGSTTKPQVLICGLSLLIDRFLCGICVLLFR